MSQDSSNTDTSPPAPPGSSLPENGAGNNVSPLEPSPPNYSSNKQPSSPSSDKSAEAPPPPLPLPLTSESPPARQTPKQQTPAPPQQQSQPPPNSHSHKSPSSRLLSSSSSSSSESSSSFSPFLLSSTASSSSSSSSSPLLLSASASASSSSSSSSPSGSDSSADSNETSPLPPLPSPRPSTPSSSSSPKALGPPTPSTYRTPNTNPNYESSGSGSSNNNSQSNVSSSSSSHDKTPIYQSLIAMLVGVLVVVFVVLFFYFRGRKKKQQRSTPGSNMPPPANSTMKPVTYEDGQTRQSSGLDGVHGQPCTTANTTQGGSESSIVACPQTYFTYDELMDMTDGFSGQNLIGKGGFGCVYKGRMPDGRVVAVKQLMADSGQGEREFRAEVEIISRVHHKHLVSLVGYSTAENQRLLIYEFVPNRTLEHHLHCKDLPVLEWAKRVKIALGAAKGLAYLHEDCHPKIIHRDIKSANILLEDNFEAKVADFGLARLNDATQSQTHVSTRVMGTIGYLAPEYASSGKLTDRSDVYSFGVVLLELITGRKPIDSTRPLGDESLVEWARPLLIQALETGDYSELIDPRLENRYEEREIVKMIEAAAACVRQSFSNRPHMALVVRALDFEGDPDLSNGVKYGDSKTYDSAKYSEEIMQFRFRQTAVIGTGSGDNSSEMDRGYNSREVSGGRQGPWNSQYSSGDYTSTDLQTRTLEPDSGHYRPGSTRP